MARQNADLQPQAQAHLMQRPVQQTGHQTHRTGSQRDERVDGIAGQGAADHVGQCAHDKTARRAEPDCCQVGGQSAQVEPQESGGHREHAGKDDAHGREQGQHRQGTNGQFGMIHR